MLKQWLSLLLSKFYSKQESDLVGHQAMPSENKIVLTPAVLEASHWMDMLNATAVSDGYVVAQASSTAQSGFLAIRQNPNQTIVTGTGEVSQAPTLTLPISKGASFTVLGDKVKNLSVWFVPIIGGGYKRFIQLVRRTSICLSPSFNCLQKRFSRVDTKTLPFKSEGRTRAKSQLLLQTFLNGAIQLRHQVTLPFGFRRLKIRGSELIMSLPGCPISPIITGHGRLQRFQSKKETRSFSDYLPRLMFQRLRAGLLLAFVNLKLNKGGATC